MSTEQGVGAWAFQQKRLFIIVTILFTLLGVLTFQVVPKDEDPRLPDWFATLNVVFPGGEVQQIDQMIARPINEKLKEIDELKKVETTTRVNVTSLQL